MSQAHSNKSHSIGMSHWHIVVEVKISGHGPDVKLGTKERLSRIQSQDEPDRHHTTCVLSSE